MLCEIDTWGNFAFTWAFMTITALVMVFIMSGTLFLKSYVNPTFEQWQYKSNPKYPSPEMVRSEIIQMCKGIGTATVCPALSLYLAKHNLSQAYCGVEPYGWTYLAFSFVACWLASDFVEWYYHRLGHSTDFGWKQHKFHHIFYNPSPFAVVADEYVDQFIRSAPLLVFPLLVPINIDMFFFQFGAFFYAYGVYLHWGYELDYPNAHHPWINTAFHHYCHHAKSIKNKPYYTGFYLTIWDQMAGSCYTGKCFCSKCAREEGKRSREAFAEVYIPDYSVLLQPSFWFGKDKDKEVKSELQRLNVGESDTPAVEQVQLRQRKK